MPSSRSIHAPAGLRTEDLLQQGDQDGAVGHTRAVGAEAVILAQIRTVDLQTELAILLVGANGDGYGAIARRKCLIRYDAGMRIAVATGGYACGQVVLADIGQPGHLRIEQRHIDRLPPAALPAFVQRSKDGCGGE